MRRRTFMLATGAAAVAAAGAYYWPEQGFSNPCLSPTLPESVRRSAVLQEAWEGIDPARVWDMHVHLIGVGDAVPDLWINPRMYRWFHPVDYAQRLFFLDAGCARGAHGEVDGRYVARMRALADAVAPGFKLVLLAYDYTHDAAGERDPARSAMHTPNEYAQRLAATHPERFEWAASIHPYRRDCVQALEWAVRHGARMVKWLPPAMGIDPASPRCDRFYQAAARLGIPVLSHAGEEKAVHGAQEHAFGNPLRLRRALDHGVRVIVAHCASTGEDVDLDRGENGPAVASFDLFARLMDDPRYAGRVFGDVSAILQINRSAATIRRILERTDWHVRLLNGSDYPLPGVMPLISVRRLIAHGLLPALAGEELKVIRAHNPLLFDLALKRTLRAGGARFAAELFHTRDFFQAAAGAAAA
jgi:mannonate dehydratase